MSARAAARLVSLGCTNVYRYQAGRADWFAAGLPREGKEAGTPRVADIAQRDVPTCRLDERVGDVRDRRAADGSEPFVVVDGDRVVLGLVDAEALTGDPTTPIERVMQSDPVSFRPDVRIGETPQYFKQHGVRHTLVTTSDGVLIGLLRMEQTGGASAP